MSELEVDCVLTARELRSLLFSLKKTNLKKILFPNVIELIDPNVIQELFKSNR